HVTGWTRWVSPMFEQVFGPRRRPESDMTSTYQDVAAALQRVVEEAVLALVRHMHTLVPSRNLCLVGGLALNSVLNGRIEREGPFENIFITPAANDAGTALGGALFLANKIHSLQRVEASELAYLGPDYSSEQCAAAAARFDVKIERPAELIERVADLLAGGKIIAWFHGRMEVGPRSLGNRSILADPRDLTMKDTINHRVKHRESFRPFAPSVLYEAANDYFEGVKESPYMVRREQRSRVPAITHVDGTARVQTVRRDQNPIYYRLIEAFGQRTGVPMLLNASFNVRGEPIVCTPEDAIACFRGTGID